MVSYEMLNVKIDCKMVFMICVFTLQVFKYIWA